MSARFYSLCHQGLVRTSNQDAILTDQALKLWAVADGMGGHRKGDLASRLACASLQQAIVQGTGLVEAFEQAHARIRMAQRQEPGADNMGTTLVAILEDDYGFELAWVGDSRAYQLSHPSQGVDEAPQLRQLTKDHNVAARLFEQGEITADQVSGHPHRHVLTDCIGQPQGMPTIEYCRLNWQPGDRLLLCSDGLTGEVNDEAMLETLSSSLSLDLVCQSLINQALSNGGGDNIAVVVLDSPLA
ncbi:MAG: protein phosphatase 2C domain-containing protein [Pseudomonadota bacterium]